MFFFFFFAGLCLFATAVIHSAHERDCREGKEKNPVGHVGRKLEPVGKHTRGGEYVKNVGMTARRQLCTNVTMV